MEDYRKNAEENLLALARQEEINNRRLLNLEKFLIWMTLIVSLVMILVGCYLSKDHEMIGMALCIFGTVVVLVSCCVGLKIEHDAGYYECPNCGHRYVPTMKAIVLAPHIGLSRKMKCPQCGERKYHKKVLTK